MNLVENAWGCFGAAFGPTILLSLFWRKFNYYGAVAGVISGAAADILWLMFLTETGIYEIIPGFICSLAVAVIASKITGEPRRRKLRFLPYAGAQGEENIPRKRL